MSDADIKSVPALKGLARRTQNICITFIQCYTNVLCLLGIFLICRFATYIGGLQCHDRGAAESDRGLEGHKDDLVI